MPVYDAIRHATEFVNRQRLEDFEIYYHSVFSVARRILCVYPRKGVKRIQHPLYALYGLKNWDNKRVEP